MANKITLTSPVGRIVAGSLYEPNDKDPDGNPLKVKTGANAGKDRVNYFFALAITKGQEKAWWETSWGAQILQVGQSSFPQTYNTPSFAWKIEDGDSTIPNKKGTKPCDKEGYPGHWIVKFNGGFAPTVYMQENGAFVKPEVGYVKPGYYVEVCFNVEGNTGPTPGVYLNYTMVCFRAFGPELNFGPNVNDAGFGQNPLPAGATLTPPPSATPMPTVPPANPSAAVPASVPVPAVTPAPTAIPSTLPPSNGPVPVMPNPGFLQMPAPGGVPATTGAVPAVSPTPTVPVPSTLTVPSNVRQMTAKAGGQPYEAFTAMGWTDANLIAQGYMLP